MLETTTEGKYKYFESKGEGDVLLLLHGLFGATSNFTGIIDAFGRSHNVVIPILPIYELPLLKVSLTGLLEYVEDFVNFKGYNKVHILGNSLGGHISLLYTLKCPERVQTLILTGSSGLYESGMGNTFPKRSDYNFIKTKTETTFYRPETATKELVDEVYDIVNDRMKAIRVLATAKSAIRHNVGDRLHEIKCPTLIIWGKEDSVTPAFVADKFHSLIENTELHIFNECGHAPMWELPKQFNAVLDSFLERHPVQLEY